MHEKTKVILTSIVGNIAEQYDLVLYGYFAPIFVKLFFPAGNEFLATTLTFAIFAGGFLTRPLGGMIFGHIGDRYGRKQALVLSIILITIPTVAIGLLPSYSRAGILAPLLLTLFRLLQGLFISGELAGSGIFLIESAPENKKGLWGCLALFSTYLGFVLGALVSIVVTSLFSETVVATFAWRLPFLLAAVLGVAATITRVACAESALFREIVSAKKYLRLPVVAALQKHLSSIIWIFLLNAVGGVSFYLVSGYFPTFFVTKLAFTLKQTMLLNGGLLLLITILVPFFGWWSDYFSRRAILALGAIGFIVFAYPIFVLLASGHFVAMLLSEALIAFFLAAIAGVCITFSVEILPITVRYSVIAIAYNLGMTVFGGTSPLMATLLVKWFHSNIAPFVFLLFAGVITLIAIFQLRTKSTT